MLILCIVRALARLTAKHVEWNLDNVQVSSAVARLVADKVTVAGLEADSRLLFLYAKGVLADEKSIVRKTKFEELLTDAKMAHNRDRLARLVTEGEHGSSIKKNENTFDLFVAKNPAWNDPKTSFVVFRDHEQLRGKNAFVERVQVGRRKKKTRSYVMLRSTQFVSLVRCS